MTQTDVKPPMTRSKLVALAIFCILSAGVGYSAVMKLAASPKDPEQVASNVTTATLPTETTAYTTVDPMTPPVIQAKSPLLSLSPAAKEYLTLSKKALLDEQRERAFLAEEKAKAAKHQLNKPPVTVVEAVPQNNVVPPAYYDAGLPPPESAAPKAQPLDKLFLVSIIESETNIKGFVTFDGNLVPITEGSHIGSIEVLALMPDHAIFSDGKRKKTLWVASK